MNESEYLGKIARLEEKNRELCCRIEELTKFSLMYEEKCKEIDGLNETIKFLEGQIEAYQYCMNCRR